MLFIHLVMVLLIQTAFALGVLRSTIQVIMATVSQNYSHMFLDNLILFYFCQSNDLMKSRTVCVLDNKPKMVKELFFSSSSLTAPGNKHKQLSWFCVSKLLSNATRHQGPEDISWKVPYTYQHINISTNFAWHLHLGTCMYAFNAPFFGYLQLLKAATGTEWNRHRSRNKSEATGDRTRELSLRKPSTNRALTLVSTTTRVTFISCFCDISG